MQDTKETPEMCLLNFKLKKDGKCVYSNSKLKGDARHVFTKVMGSYCGLGFVVQ